MDEEHIYVITQYKIKYTKESTVARRDAVHAALAMASTITHTSTISDRYTVERGFTYWEPGYVPNHATT